ncbi:MAG: hypothetical protein MJ252_11375 [archaeon]|nr:hypothetical protein [archaeon]
MSIQCQESMNFSNANIMFNKALSHYKNFFQIVKKYYDIVLDYDKKLKSVYDSFNKSFIIPKNVLKNMSESEKEYHKIMSNLTDCFGRIIYTHLDACKDRLDGLNLLLNNVNPGINEKKKEYSNYYRDFQDASSDLKGFYKKVISKKNDFFKAAETTEDSLEKICKFRNANDNSKDASFEYEYKKAAQSTDKNLATLKEKYTEYRKVVANSKSFEDTFTLRLNSSTSNLNNLTLKTLEDLKKSTVYFNGFELSACSKIKMEIETLFPTLDKYDITNFYLTYVTNNTISNLPLKPMTIKKYQPKVLNKFYKTQNNLDFDDMEGNNNEYIIEASSNASSDDIPFDNVHYIVEKLFKSIHKGLDDLYDVELEKKKFTLHNLSKKFLTKEKSSLSEAELVEFKEFLKNRELRKFFLQNLNLLRSKGIFLMQKDNFEIIGCFLNMILSYLDKDNLDFYCARGLIILSQTFYCMEEGSKKKLYLQEYIKENKLFKEKAFWENFIVASVEDGLKNNPLTKNRKFSDFEGDSEADLKETAENVNNLSNIAFGQLISISDNMKEFGLSNEEIKAIQEPFMDKYKISKENKEAILSLLI